MYEVYDISETAFREFSNKHCVFCDVPVGSYCAVGMSFITDDVHPLLFCVFDISDTPESPTISCNDLYEHDKQAYLMGIKSPIYGNDYEVWHVLPDSVIPGVATTYYQVRGYVAEDEPTETYDSDYCINGSFNSCRLATEFAYTIFNSPCYYVTVHSYVGDEFEESKILELKSDRRLYSRFVGRVHREVA